MDPRPPEPALGRRVVTDSRLLSLWLVAVGVVLFVAATVGGGA